jgi:tetratricopeptide (TPR) repeat protein
MTEVKTTSPTAPPSIVSLPGGDLSGAKAEWAAVVRTKVANAAVRARGEQPPDESEQSREALAKRADQFPFGSQKRIDLLEREAESYLYAGQAENDSEEGRRLLSTAVERFNKLLNERPRETDLDLLGWAQDKVKVGAALEALGRREEDGRQRLGQAIEAFREALNEPQLRVPLGGVEWSTAQESLGSALMALGEKEGERESGQAARLERFQQAAQAYGAALMQVGPDRVPRNWARVIAAHADALIKIARFGTDIAARRTAVSQASNELNNALHIIGTNSVLRDANFMAEYPPILRRRLDEARKLRESIN